MKIFAEFADRVEEKYWSLSLAMDGIPSVPFSTWMYRIVCFHRGNICTEDAAKGTTEGRSCRM